MTVVVLRLSGIDAVHAMAAANELLEDRENHPVLRRMLLIDDTAALVDHVDVYQRLLTSKRLISLLCVALGPEGQSLPLQIPPNITSRQGSGVIWVSDVRGIDWRMSATKIADGHAGNQTSGLDYLVGVLSVDEVFDEVLTTMQSRGVLNGVASPGLHLAGADDEAASFAAALNLAIERLTGPGSGIAAGVERPLVPLMPGTSGTVSLAEDGELAAYHARIIGSAASVAEALGKSRGGLLPRRGPDVGDRVVAIGKELGAFRSLVMRLFTEAQSAGELTEAQRNQVTAAGVLLPDPLPSAASAAGHNQTAAADDSRSGAYGPVVEAVRAGDTLPRVVRQLTLAGQQLKHKGSVSYLPEVEKACPSGLLDRLARPAQRPSGKTAADAWQRGLGLEDAARAADGLAALVVTVARQEWSGGATVAAEVTRTRIALDGISKRLTEHAAQTGTPAVSGVRATQLTRLGDSLTPILCDLVSRVLAAEFSQPKTAGQEAYDRAQARTGDLITEWTRHAAQHGATSPPKFATSVVHDRTYADDDMAAIREALKHDPNQEMWQLCGPDDIGALDGVGSSQVVAFAPRGAKEALGKSVPEHMTWYRSGSYAGLIRLVPLRPEAARVEWADQSAEPTP